MCVDKIPMHSTMADVSHLLFMAYSVLYRLGTAPILVYVWICKKTFGNVSMTSCVPLSNSIMYEKTRLYIFIAAYQYRILLRRNL